MTPNTGTRIEPEEAEALRESAPGSSRVEAVEPRDFAHPRTLSKERLRRIRKTISARLGNIANELARPLRGHHRLTLGSVTEVAATGLFDGFVKPFVVHGFECAGKLGWLIWDSAAASAACEIALSGPIAEVEVDEESDEPAPEPVEPEARLLSRTESKVIATILDTVALNIAEVLNLEALPGEVWQEPEELTTLEDLGPDADGRRLSVHLEFDSPGVSSTILLYMPGVLADDDESDAQGAEQAPSHLTGVNVRVDAQLGAIEVPLRELLGLEVGDVVPLDARVGSPAALRIGDSTYATARFGASDGRMAVVIEDLVEESEPETEEAD